MTEFKQIIGRGTRVRDDYGKFYFSILDYTGSATRLFADPEFDGEPALLTEEEMNEAGEPVGEPAVISVEQQCTEEPGVAESDVPSVPDDSGDRPPRKYYVDNAIVEITAHIVHELDADGKQLRVVKYTDYTAEKAAAWFLLPPNFAQSGPTPTKGKQFSQPLKSEVSRWMNS